MAVLEENRWKEKDDLEHKKYDFMLQMDIRAFHGKPGANLPTGRNI